MLSEKNAEWIHCDPPQPTPPATPTLAVSAETIRSLKLEIVRLLCEQQSHTNRIACTTERLGTVQVWECDEPAVEIPYEKWNLPNMDPCRACTGDSSTNWAVSFQINSPTQATAYVCSSGGYWIECDRQQLTRADGRWTAVSDGSSRNNCDCPVEP